MPTSYTTSLGLALPADSELTGTWGQTVNAFITNYLDSAIAGAQTISGTQTAVTLSRTTGATLAQAGVTSTGSSQYSIINCTGNPASLLTVTVPASSKVYLVINATTTNQQVKIVGVGSTAGVTLDAGERALIAWNGSDFLKVAFSFLFAQNQILYGSATGGFSQSSGLTFNGTNLVTTGTASATKLIPTGGTATGNGMYLPAANTVAISTNGGEVLRVDSSGNLGIGVTPSAWSGKAIEVGSVGSAIWNLNQQNSSFTCNAYYDAGVYKYGGTGLASSYQQAVGVHYWYTAPSGTAGNAISFTQAMTLDVSGNATIAGTASATKLIPTGGTATGNGVYLPAANTVAVSTNGVEALRVDASGNLGIGTTTPTSTLHVSGSFSRGVPVTKTVDFTLANNENWVICNKTGSNCVVTLPSPSACPGREVTFVHRQSQSFSLTSSISNVINRQGASGAIVPLSSGNGAWATIVSDGTNWIIMASGV